MIQNIATGINANSIKMPTTHIWGLRAWGLYSWFPSLGSSKDNRLRASEHPGPGPSLGSALFRLEVIRLGVTGLSGLGCRMLACVSELFWVRVVAIMLPAFQVRARNLRRSPMTERLPTNLAPQGFGTPCPWPVWSVFQS